MVGVEIINDGMGNTTCCIFKSLFWIEVIHIFIRLIKPWSDSLREKEIVGGSAGPLFEIDVDFLALVAI